MPPKKGTKRKETLDDATIAAVRAELRRRLQSVETVEEAKSTYEAVMRDFAAALPRVLPESATRIADALDASMARVLKARRSSFRGFERRLSARWVEGLDRLEAMIHAYAEFGAEFAKRPPDDDIEESPVVIRALVQLHGRSCRLAGEILCLMKGGFADGAQSRWRTIHEVAVIAQFLARRHQSVSSRYWEHEVILACRAAERFAKHSTAIGWDPIDAGELEELRRRRDELIARYGKAFNHDLGWAADSLGKDYPRLTDLEDAVGLAHWRPFYGMASAGIHGGVDGFKPLGRHPGLILAGPSNAALTDPGQCTVLSMAQIVTAMTVARPSINNLLSALAFNELSKRCQAALVREGEALREAARMVDSESES